MAHISEDSVKIWLKSALKNEKISNFSASIDGTPQKGEGYVGDIIFVKVNTNSARNYHLVLKCSKNNQDLREVMPVKAIFQNEIHFYEKIIPTFTDFQQRKSVANAFESVPKYFGCYMSDNQEVIALEDLRMKEYYLCDMKLPLPSDHLKLILEEFGKYHAISAALQDQEPQTFNKLLEGMPNVWKLFTDSINPEVFFGPAVDEVYNLLNDSLDAVSANKLKNLQAQIENILKNVLQDTSCFCVITHGDSWSNNFMFKKQITSNGEILRVAILDWQFYKFFSPVMDLSCFLYSCSSEEDLNDFDQLLRMYYNSFSSFVTLLGSDPNRIFPFSQLLRDFKTYGKYGVILSILAIKAALLTDADEVPDFGESSKTSFADKFNFRNKDPTLLKKRMLYITKHMQHQELL